MTNTLHYISDWFFNSSFGILPTESQKYCKNWENHYGSMADISEEDRELRNMKFSMINQHEEKNETNQSRHKHQKTKEESLARPNTIHSSVGNHFPWCNWNSVTVIISPEPEVFFTLFIEYTFNHCKNEKIYISPFIKNLYNCIDSKYIWFLQERNK